MKKAVSLFLCFVMLLCALPVFAGAAGDTDQLRFNEDGSFKILVLADCQDDKAPEIEMISAITQLLELNAPDVVVFTGDNVLEDSMEKFTEGLTRLLAPIVAKNIPYAFTFGNHDDEYGISKEDQFEVYKSIGTCLTTDPVPSLTGLGTCNIPVLHSTNDAMAFNLWMVDSNTYDKANGGYDHVHEDQLAWLLERQNEITEDEGHVVPSLMFQHIIVPEIADCLEKSDEGSWTYNGTKYALRFNGKGSGRLGEHPCPPSVNSGEYSVVCDMGGVLGIVTGHDHVNNFVAKPGDVDLIQVAGMSYQSYGSDNIRGASLITLNESNTNTYSIERFVNQDLFDGLYGYPEREPVYVQITEGATYISDIAVGNHLTNSSTAKKALTDEGYTVIDFDLNKGAGGQFIYLGYKTTTNIDEAYTSLRVYSSKEDRAYKDREFRDLFYRRLSNVDLNKGAGGYYIYLYGTKQISAGAPITVLTVNENKSTEGYTAVASFTSDTPADLNKKAKGAYIYLHTGCTLPVLDTEAFFAAYEAAVAADTGCRAAECIAALNEAVNDATELYETLKTTYRTTSSQTDIDAFTARLAEALEALNNSASHTPGDTVVENMIASTCAKKGRYENAVYCQVCGEEVSRTVVELELEEHSFTKRGQAPKCTRDGFIQYICTECGYSYKDNIMPAPGHKDNDGDGYCDVCGADLTVPKPSCSHICHKDGFLGFIWKIVNLFNRILGKDRFCECGARHW